MVSLTFTYAGFADAGTHSFYAQVDSACQVAESNETNNIYGPLRVQVSGSAPAEHNIYLPLILRQSTQGMQSPKSVNKLGWSSILPRPETTRRKR